MIEYNKVNNNLIHLLIKLLRFLNGSRNFNEQIILMDYFIGLQKKIKKKIISSLFDLINLSFRRKIY